MALIAMCCYDTVENQRTKYTIRTLNSLFSTVDLDSHHLVVVDNASCKETKEFLEANKSDGLCGYTLITNEKNIGTAEGINLAWRLKEPGQHCIKMDNDVTINSKNWVEELEQAIGRESKIGQIGLKRKDLAESPQATDPHFRSSLLMLSHQPGQKWIIVERASHIMGTCVMHSAALLNKVGYLNQPGIYGFDDSFMSLRSQKAGFINCFLPHIEIDHIDTGENLYTKEKQKLASEAWPEYQRIAIEYQNGQRSVYYNPFEK